MLALLEEKRAALISRAVTRGLDPDVPMKPSDLEWLGDIPVHWEIRRAKVLFHEIDQRTTTGEEVLLSLRMNQGLVPHNDVSEKPIPSHELIGFKLARVNQIVINRMRAASGLIAVSHQDGLVSPDYAVFESKQDVLPKFFKLLFKTPLLQSVFRSASKGLGTGSSGFLRLYSENFLSIKLPVPPLEEQGIILTSLECERIYTAKLEEALHRSIALLKERRSALITAAVTGQLQISDNQSSR